MNRSPLVLIAPNQIDAFKAISLAVNDQIAEITGQPKNRPRKAHDLFAQACGFTSLAHINALSKGIEERDQPLLLITKDNLPKLALKLSQLIEHLTESQALQALESSGHYSTTEPTGPVLFTPYQIKEGEHKGSWGYFTDPKRFWHPFETFDLAKKMAEEMEWQSGKSARFTAAWREAILWLSRHTGHTPAYFIDGPLDAENYQEMEPRREAFEQVMGHGSGIKAFAIQAFSFYNSHTAVVMLADWNMAELDEDQVDRVMYRLEYITPMALGGSVERDGIRIICKLAENYPGW